MIGRPVCAECGHPLVHIDAPCPQCLPNFDPLRPMAINLDIPETAEGREQERQRRIVEGWDRWYAALPDDLKRRLSIHDFRRLGECFRQAFGIERVTPPEGWPR